MTVLVSLDYQLSANGWASLVLTVAQSSIKIGPFGYCTDALGDLLRAALVMATGGASAFVSLDGEPFESRIILGREWDTREMMPIRVKTFPQIGAHASDAKGTLIFEAEARPDDFARAVLEAANSVLDEHGTEEYAKNWGDFIPPFGEFPSRAMKALEAILPMQKAVAEDT
ncbi:hypothetical protein [Acidisphaera sp. L21]|uniref:hypothetical protein n=1 Tax=Acidisphaera sp. L21 TaxID=1641851 RepID=UPI00131D7AFE|nr:hypothetical protein [Acidisphaera sp. L21]